jgi:methylamine dehydrogenase accessory protein MauD
MTTALLISNVILWVLVVALAGIVAALIRQIGVLYERVAPAGALMVAHGPAVGESVPVLAAPTIDGAMREIGAVRADGRSTLLFFLSPTCPVCKELLPALRSAAHHERDWLDVVLASDGPRAEHEAFVRTEGLDGFTYLLSAPLGVTYQVAKLPYAVLIDGAGVLRAKGLVNTREHLESLFEAQERGLASIQDFVHRGTDAAEGGRA